MRLRPTQEQALDIIEDHGALYAHAGCGIGKTLIALLAPMAAGVRGRHSLYLVPNQGLVAQAEAEADKHAVIDPPQVLSYGALSATGRARVLMRYAPRLLILDEAHLVGERTSARTRVVQAYLRQYPETHVVVMSGTLLGPRVERSAWLAQLALGAASPLPRDRRIAAAWQRIVHGTAWPVDWLSWRGSRLHPLRTIRDLVASSPGCLVTCGRVDCDASIRLERWQAPEAPQVVRTALAQLEATWELDGAVYCDATAVADTRLTLAQGFYYRWCWRPETAWLCARRGFAAAVRGYLTRHWSSVETYGDIVARLQQGHDWDRELTTAWQAWAPHSGTAEPDREAVWLSSWLVDAATAWCGRRDVLVWAGHVAVHEALAQRMASATCGTAPRLEGGPVAVRVRSHGTGFELQKYSESLVLLPPANDEGWEQMLARQHRAGQSADEVVCHYYDIGGRTEKSIDLAKITRQLTGQEQRLLLATGE